MTLHRALRRIAGLVFLLVLLTLHRALRRMAGLVFLLVFWAAAAESDAAAKTKVRTATGDADYNVDWNGIGSSDDPTLATLRLLHSARQMVDTSRWWTLRWPNSSISLLGTACMSYVRALAILPCGPVLAVLLSCLQRTRTPLLAKLEVGV